MRSRFLLPRLLSRGDAAAYCGVSTGHFVTYIAPQVHEVFVHSKRLYDRQSIDAWIERLQPGERKSARRVEPSEDELIAGLG